MQGIKLKEAPRNLIFMGGLGKGGEAANQASPVTVQAVPNKTIKTDSAMVEISSVGSRKLAVEQHAGNFAVVAKTGEGRYDIYTRWQPPRPVTAQDNAAGLHQPGEFEKTGSHKIGLDVKA